MPTRLLSVTTSAVAAGLLLTSCGSTSGGANGAEPAETVTVTAAAPTTSPPSSSASASSETSDVDCGPDSDLTMAEWTELCTGETGTGATEGPYEDLAIDVPEGGWYFEYAGTVGSVEVDVPAGDPRVADVEAYREDTGGDPITYTVAEVDNTNGTDNINMYGLTLVGGDGSQLEVTGVGDFVSEWQDTIGVGDANTDLYNRGLDVSEEASTYLLPGAVGTAVMASAEEPPAEVARMYVYPAGGFEEIEAYQATD